ncbi:MAG: hypothetical protein F7C32_02545 [Desulfurococcales archaeon]|nr:hypothetical protein [Desulfurococcales archaeon]
MSRVEEKETQMYLDMDVIREWVKKKVEELEKELKMWKTLLASLEGGSPIDLSPSEKVEELRHKRTRYAVIYRGEGYVRMRPLINVKLDSELKGYITNVINELKEEYHDEDEDESIPIDLRITENPDGTLSEIAVSGIQDTIGMLRIIGALKYVAHTLFLKSRKKKF